LKSKKYKIVLTGPESTGKSSLSEKLAEHYNTIWLPEYARTYLSTKGSAYNIEDVIHIAHRQPELESSELEKANKILFIDTDLIITKYWFLEVYSNMPENLDDEITKNQADLYLLCFYDLPWEPDPLRENGGERRIYLYNLYLKELRMRNCNYKIIQGIGEERVKAAIQIVDDFLNKPI